MIKILESNNRQDEYNEYLDMHIGGVKRSWNEILVPYLLDSGFEQETIDMIERDYINKHDESKYSKEEYDAYLEYFYPSEGRERDFDRHDDELVELEFDKAWLHHQHNSPHHWQYWILVRDGGELVPMDMSLEAVFEMLCDWHSFTLKNPESTAYKWYQDNKDKMILSDNTRRLVDEYIEVFSNNPLTKR